MAAPAADPPTEETTKKGTAMVRVLSRKRFMTGAAATVALPAVLRHSAMAAQFTLKLGHDIPVDLPHQPSRHRRRQDQSRHRRTGGTALFPNNQLGNDNHMLSQLRSGAMQMMAVGDNILAEFVPPAAIDNIAFAFKDRLPPMPPWTVGSAHWCASRWRRSGCTRWRKCGYWFSPDDHRHQTDYSPADLHGFKIRVPPSPISLSMFKDLGAAPMTLNAAEIYTALQTHLADGQENPLGTIEANKMYEVQKYCSMTSHMWCGYWVLANGSAWKAMPAKSQDTVAEAFDSEARSSAPTSRR